MSRGRRIGRLKLVPPSPEAAKKYLTGWDGKRLYKDTPSFPAIVADTFFGIDQPLQVDIGCGSGEFLCELASSQPDHFHLGIEISKRAIYRAVNNAAQRNLPNVHFLKADFHLLYPLLEPNSWEKVYFLFPDPNIGKKNIKRRIFNNIFLDALSKTLAPQGTATLISDHKEFFGEMYDLAFAHPAFQFTHTEPYLTNPDFPFTTRFQNAWEGFQKEIYRFEIQRRKPGL